MDLVADDAIRRERAGRVLEERDLKKLAPAIERGMTTSDSPRRDLFRRGAEWLVRTAMRMHGEAATASGLDVTADPHRRAGLDWRVAMHRGPAVQTEFGWGFMTL